MRMALRRELLLIDPLILFPPVQGGKSWLLPRRCGILTVMEKEFIEAVTVGTSNDAEQAKPVRRRLEEDGIHCQYTWPTKVKVEPSRDTLGRPKR